ncbi:MAG: glycosyltransferase family 4 protein [Flavobacteriales bacterium]|jgi:glycosyltransferase involved in cell wall biosynthesis|nr:glycosyltransferase family 4 protein [Flavobacteriales bacterium]NCG30089.1 glycosyltransferase [Bacteroidota bacterium]MBT3963674.1 glycosyltransferase family 4 protein [Flavobacteriales bacterium]MBT4704780.1 glycosyltransferase family 4 protein [Flavobacteriales bacterium]MBT4931637.1 glycosyltransferase family 4 protein [Flavobacteriales bacterium]
MRIAVNTRLLLPNKLDGIGWFSHEVLKRLTTELNDWEFIFLFDRPFDSEFIYSDNVEGRILNPQARHPLLYQWYFERTIPHKLKRMDVDLFFSPDGFLSTKTSVKQVPVIHDINFEHRPQDLPRSYRNYYRKYFPQFARKAERIITVSDFSAQDICNTYNIDLAKLDVAHNGGNEAFRLLNSSEKETAKKQFANGNEYFIFIGSFSYRKNIHGIIKAFDAYRKQGGKHHLVLVGNPMWKYDEMDRAIKASPNRDNIHFPGRLEVDQLVSALGGSRGLVFPSYFEGFGIPIVEAFRAGVPVITSTLTSLPEVGGDAALYADPDNIETIADHMMSLEKDTAIHTDLVQKGQNRAKQYSWDHTATKVKESLFRSLDIQ